MRVQLKDIPLGTIIGSRPSLDAESILEQGRVNKGIKIQKVRNFTSNSTHRKVESVTGVKYKTSFLKYLIFFGPGVTEFTCKLIYISFLLH